MWPRTALLCWFVLPIAIACIAAEGSEREDKSRQSTYVLEIDAEHTMTTDILHQHILVKEDTSFCVSTRVGKTRWTFSGDVGRAVEGHLPVLLKSQWFASAESNTSSVSPHLLKINEKVKRSFDAIHGPLISVAARAATEADQLATSTDMQQALRRMVEDLKQVRAANLSVDISLEGDARKEVEIKLGSRAEKTLQKALPGKITVELPAKGNGEHYLYFRCPGYAEQWVRIEFSDGKIAPEHVDVALRRTRYVILRCTFNTKNNRTLTGDDVVEQRVALSHWTAPRYFSGDWQVWQKVGGTTLQLNFHRLTSGFGFLEPASGTSYDDMKEAPESGYRCNHIEAQKGLVLYCRVNGDRQFGLGYGKILVEDVVDAVPKGIRVVDGRK